MIKNNFYLNLISIEKNIFSGFVTKINITGIEGELGLFPGHAPLLTMIKPGFISFIKDKHLIKTEYLYISGGILEVKPNIVVVLADTVIRGQDIDEKRAIKTKNEVEYFIKNSNKNINFIKLTTDLAKEIAKLKVIEYIKNFS